eukprot:tig00021038_g17510.t1
MLFVACILNAGDAQQLGAGLGAGSTSGASAGAGRRTLRLETAPATELVMGALMPDYADVEGMGGTRAMFIGREATGKYFVRSLAEY